MGLSVTVSSLWLIHSIINKIKPAVVSSIIYLFLLVNMIMLKHRLEKNDPRPSKSKKG